MDNFHIDVTSNNPDLLSKVMEIGFSNNSKKAVGYVIRDNTMIFLWSGYENLPDAVMFPFQMDYNGAADFVSRWLASLNVDAYGPEPDHDGHNSKGWRVFNEAWGHVYGIRAAMVGVKPTWAWHGK
jgi:hypothetical protein